MLVTQSRSDVWTVRPYVLAMPALLALEGILILLSPPLLDAFLRTHPAHALVAIWLIPLCVARIANGILDHRMIARTLGASSPLTA
jgi:hypothetical protein